MKYWQRVFAVLALCVVATFPVLVEAEAVSSFVATYEIRPDGTVMVTEAIEYEFDEADKHGLFRILERDHPQPADSWLQRRVVDIEVVEVTRNGAAEPFTTTTRAGEIEIRIGDAGQTVSGRQRYTILYQLTGALSYGSDGAELYWNVTGTRWEVPLQVAEAVVVGPVGLLGEERACYVGQTGSTEGCEVTQTSETRTVFRTTDLAPQETLTIGQSVVPTAVATLVRTEWRLALILVPVWLLMVGGIVAAFYRRQVFNRPVAPIIAQYEPYPGLLPMYTGVVFDGRLDPHDITAGIVYLAEQGFITIRHIESKVLGIFASNDYELTLRRPIMEAPNESFRAILELIFDGAAADPSVEPPVLLSALAKRQTKNYQAIQRLQATFQKALAAEGYYETPAEFLRIGRWSWVMLLLAFTGITALVSLVMSGGLVFVGLLGLLGIAIIIMSFIGRRTRKGYEARYHLLGFRDFLSVTDRERFAFHNAPEKSPELFMAYLPYAIALKVEDKWAKAFADMTMPQPEWYTSSHSSAFSAAAFTSDLGSFASSFNASSGTSGSSGGGSAGGGGGGGGGGSW